MNKSVEAFDELDHQNSPEEYLHQIDAYMSSSIGEQHLDLLAVF